MIGTRSTGIYLVVCLRLRHLEEYGAPTAEDDGMTFGDILHADMRISGLLYDGIAGLVLIRLVDAEKTEYYVDIKNVTAFSSEPRIDGEEEGTLDLLQRSEMCDGCFTYTLCRDNQKTTFQGADCHIAMQPSSKQTGEDELLLERE